MEKLDGFYRGIIVQNNDPERLGRVKVFVPHLHLASIDIDAADYDSEFYFGEFGTNYQPKGKKLVDLTKYIEKIKFKLPWAEISLPITGGGFSSFNSASKRATVSDSPSYVNQQAEEDGSTGAPAGADVKRNPPSDAFSASSDNPNPLGSSYNAQAFYNAPKGMFGIPQVNAKVWLFFLNGNPHSPVVFGYSPSANTYNEIYDDTNYPSGYENNDNTGQANPENLKRRQMTALNYKGGSISFNGTDNEEALSITHDSGSHTEYNNSGKKSLVMGQNSKLVKGAQYTTIEDTASFFCGDDTIYKVSGDINIQAGTANYAAAQRWKDAAANIHAVKSLPESQNSGSDSFFSSPLARKGGVNPPCPSCSKGKAYQTLIGGNGDEVNIKTINGNQKKYEDLLKLLPSGPPGAALNVQDAAEEQFPKKSDCKVCGGSGFSPSTMGGNFPKDSRKNELGKLYLNSAKDFFEAENEMGNGGNMILNVTKDFFLSVGCASNDFDSIRINKKGAAHDIGMKLDAEKGLYPSQVVSSVVEKVHVDRFPGGQFTIDAQNGINLIGGSGGFDLNSTGVMSIYGTITEISGEQVNLSSKSGLNIATDEVISLKAPNVSIHSDNQTFIKNNVAVDGNMVCRGGMMVQGELFAQHITAPLCFQETETQSELYGRAYPEKPLVMGFIKNTQEIKCTIESKDSDPGMGWYVISDYSGSPLPVQGKSVMSSSTVTLVLTQYVPIYTTDSGQKAEDGSIYVYPHSHVFRNLPLTLGGTYEEVRANASGIDGNDLVASKKVENGLTAPEIQNTTRAKGVGLSNQLNAKQFAPIQL
jgi:phage baseplate assembly protein gpV